MKPVKRATRRQTMIGLAKQNYDRVAVNIMMIENDLAREHFSFHDGHLVKIGSYRGTINTIDTMLGASTEGRLIYLKHEGNHLMVEINTIVNEPIIPNKADYGTVKGLLNARGLILTYYVELIDFNPPLINI